MINFIFAGDAIEPFLLEQQAIDVLSRDVAMGLTCRRPKSKTLDLTVKRVIRSWTLRAPEAEDKMDRRSCGSTQARFTLHFGEALAR